MNRTVARYTETSTKNALGEVITSTVFDASGVKCRLVPITAEELAILPGEYSDVEYTGYFLSSQSLTTDDIIKYDGDSYEVRNVYLDSQHYTLKALLKKSA